MAADLDIVLARPGAYERSALVAKYGRRACDGALADARMVRVARGIFAGTLHAESLWTRAHALVLACGAEAAISGHAALFLHGCVLSTPTSALVVTTSPTRVRRRVPQVHLLRTMHAFPALPLHGIPTAAPEVALLHAMGEMSRERARALALEALASQRIDVGTVAQTVGERRFRGRRALREALAAFDVGVRSVLEYDGLTQVLPGPEFAHLIRQHAITVEGRRMLLDTYDPALKVAFEFDGVAFHTSRERWESDRERDTLLASVGIQTVRFTSRDVRERAGWCRVMALAVLAQRRGLVTP
ncbi:hypothetical protein [Demequina sp.]|uniref:hypothetical protein n=1 Tax=Demequina sp. TaxID=2050685 RepID=UPI003A8626B1